VSRPLPVAGPNATARSGLQAQLFGLGKGLFENLTSYTEVIQHGMVHLLKSGTLICASATASLSPDGMTEVNANMASYHDRIAMRPGNMRVREES
jgi:succinyl-CoA:acetate CoA-transferase